jgi:uncharacterized membrane protein YdbT with pleckstrin-like domain
MDASKRTAIRPSLAGGWFLYLGLIMGPAIIIFERDPQGRPALWIVMTAFFLVMILHRLSVAYYLDDKSLTQRSWWGLLGPVVIEYRDITGVDIKYSFASRISGTGHLFIATHGDSSYMTILSQKDPEKLKIALERLARAARINSEDSLEKDDYEEEKERGEEEQNL